MKINKKPLILGIILLSFLFTIPNVKGFDDIEYEFEQDILYNETDPELSLFNLRQQQVYNGTYNSTYTFTNEIEGTNGTDIEFVDIDNSGVNFATIISNKNAHSKVLALNDVSGTSAEVHNLFDVSFGTIEFWLSSTDVSKESNIALKNEGNFLFVIFIDTDKFRYYDGSNHDVIGSITPINDSWFHLKLDFECTNGNYLGLAQYTWRISINNINYDGDYTFNSNENSVDGIQLYTDSSDQDYISYYDGFGYSWDINFDIIDDFSDDIPGNQPIGWEISESENSYANITDSLNNHDNVFTIYDGHVAGITDAKLLIGSSIGNDIRFDFAVGELFGAESYLTLYEDDALIIDILFQGTNVYNYYLAYTPFKTGFLQSNIFNTYYLVFNYSFNQYDVYVNGILEGDNLKFRTNISITGIDEIGIKSDNSFPSDYEFHIDNIYTNISTNYFINDNIIPILDVLEGFEGLLETDKYEFSMLDVNERVALGATSYGLWSFSDTGSGATEIVVDVGVETNLDRRIEFFLDGAGSTNIKRTNLGITESLIDINFGFLILDTGSGNANFTILLEASDQSTITGIRLEEATDSLFYFDGSIWILLRNDLALLGEDEFDLNISLNYDIDVVVLGYTHDGVFIENHAFKMISTGKSGLFEISATWEKSGGGGGLLLLDYVGLYRDGESWHGELGIITIPINLSLHFERHYLYSIEALGRIHDGVVEGSYTVGEASFQNILDDTTIERIYISEVETFNIYENFISNISNTTLVYTVVGSDISINSINIEGSKLTEGINEYFLEFSSGGLEPMDNYFYVSGNQLLFKHNTSLDNVLEFIQAEFNIDDKTSIDTAITFSSRSDNNAFGFFRVNFTLDTSQLILIDTPTSRTKRVLLSTDKTINSFIILISDTNKNSIEGLTEGQVSNIKLLDIEVNLISIVSSNLIEMLIPLIIIILPTLAISGNYGDFLVVPLFILFSLILTITGILPIWLSFVIFISSSLFIFFDKSKRGID